MKENKHISVVERKEYGHSEIDITIDGRKYTAVTQSSIDRLLSLTLIPVIEIDAKDGIDISFIWQNKK